MNKLVSLTADIHRLQKYWHIANLILNSSLEVCEGVHIMLEGINNYTTNTGKQTNMVKQLLKPTVAL